MSRLLEPWGVALFVALAALAYFAAYRWHRAHPGRPDLHLDVAAIAFLGLLTAGFFWRALTERDLWMPAGGGDFASFYFPNYSYAAAQIKAGVFPLWNPHLFAGMPLAADVQSALFYPVNLFLFLFVDVDYGSLEWLLIFHYWLASVFMYLFLRDVGQRRLGALAGAVVFAFCGFMVAHFGHLPMVPVATWIPLVLLCLRRASATSSAQSWAWAIGAGLAMAMSLLAGHVQIFAYGLMAAGLLWVFLGFKFLVSGFWFLVTLSQPGTRNQEPGTAFSWILKGALAVTVALAIGAIQLLPSLELSTQSVRSSVSYEEAMAFPAQPLSLLNLVLPRVYGSNPTNYNFGIYQTTENWGYCGVVTLALAAAGLLFRRTRMLAFFAALAALALIIMVGDLTIVSGWLFKFVPGFNKLRDAGRALVLLGLALGGLAGYGLDALVAAFRARGEARRNALWWLAGLTAAVVICAFGIMPVFYREILLGGRAEYGRLPGAINDLGILILWLGLVAGIGWAALRRRIEPALAGALIFGVLVLDLFSPNSQFNPTKTDETAGFKKFEAIAYLKENTQDPRSGIPLRVNSDTGLQESWQPSTAVLPEVELYETGGAWNPLKLERYDFLWNIASRYPDTPLYDLTGAAFEIISPTTTMTESVRAGQAKWERVFEQPDLHIYRNRNALPRAFLVHEAAIEDDPESIVVSLRRFDVEPRHTVILESGTPMPSQELGTAEPGASGESVRALRYTPNEVEIEVTARSPGWLVLTDAWYPGWKATVDGSPTPIEPANYAYRAVRVEAGIHVVKMLFRPDSWVWGRLISAVAVGASLLALGALLLWPRFRRRRNRASTVAGPKHTPSHPCHSERSEECTPANGCIGSR